MPFSRLLGFDSVISATYYQSYPQDYFSGCIYAILGQAENARRYGQLCLEASQEEGVPPFFLGYAYEALARAEATGGDREKSEAFTEKAKAVAERIQKPEDKKQLLDDLATI